MPIWNEPIPFGKTGLMVTRIGLGCAPISGGPISPETAHRGHSTVRGVIDNGLRLIDTAPLYGAGRSEQLVGQALQGIPRDRYVLSTKVGRRITDDGKVIFDWSRDGLLRGIEESLRRLNLDAVDILLMHDPDDHFREALDVAFPTLADLRAQGVIRAIGAGMNQWRMPLEFARNADFDCFLLAGRYTLLEHEPAREFLPYCHQHNIGIILGGVLNSGILAVGAQPGATYNYAPAPPAIMERVTRIEQVCSRYDVPLRVAALQFPLANPGVTSMVVGALSADEVSANARALEVEIPAQLWSDLKRDGLLPDDLPVPA